LTLPDKLTMTVSAARACPPTAVVSPLAPVHLNPALILVNQPHLIGPSALPKLPPTSLTTPPNPSTPRTNRESPMQNA